MYKLFLTTRYLRKRRIAYFAIAAVTLCVAMVLVVLSVMGGWLDMVKRQARGLLGDVIVDNQAYGGFPLYQEFIDEISVWPEIEKATPVLYTYGLFHVHDSERTGKIVVVGLRLEDVFKVNAFKKSLFYEKWYPGTTRLGPQPQPLLGFDPEPVLREVSPGGPTEQFLIRAALPPPYEQALEQARAQRVAAAEARGADPDLIPDEVLSGLDELLVEHGRLPIPGRYASNLEGEQPTFRGPEYPGLIMGRDLVAERHSDGRYERYYPRGTLVTITLWATSARGNVDPIPIKQPFRYADDSRTGIYEIDSQHVYCDFSLLQTLLQMDEAPRVNADGEIIGTSPARCSQIQINVKDGLAPGRVNELTDRLEQLYWSFLERDEFDLSLTERSLVSRVRAMTWQESQAHIIAPVEKERILVTILFGIISLVAVALILCILYMIVLQKTRDIGIIKAIGGSAGGVALIFVIYGAAVGLVGGLFGTLLGTIFVTYINEIQDFLIQVNPAWRVWDLQVYSFDRIPSVVNPNEAVAVALIAIGASAVGSVVAALVAGFMHPVEALRHE